LKQFQQQPNIREQEKSSSAMERDFPFNNMHTLNKKNKMKIAAMIGGSEVTDSGDIDLEFRKQMSNKDDNWMYWAKNKLHKAGFAQPVQFMH